MKVIIAGSRTITCFPLVFRAVKDSGFEITEVVCGCARGVDMLGNRYANFNRLPVKLFPADWKKYGKQAGYLRNKQMAEYADALICVWDGKSKGSKMMLDLAANHKLKIYEVRI